MQMLSSERKPRADFRPDIPRNYLTKKVTVMNPLGLHARTAARIAKIAEPARSNVWIVKGDEKADGKSIIDVLMLACGKGSQIVVKIESPSDSEILDTLARYIEDEYEDIYC